MGSAANLSSFVALAFLAARFPPSFFRRAFST
jgi:hypothetical protein